MTTTIQSVPPSPAAAVRSGSTSHYRPDWDGLRTIAVYAVLLFHAGMTTFAGGFIGVDVFFVLSGFLITRLLLSEIDRTQGLALMRFYARRMRRLLPASWVTLVVGSLIATALIPPASLEDLGKSVRSAFLWFANWHFVSVGNDYFHAEDSPSPFLHYWSLSLEEQFYLVWPAILLATALVARRLRRSTDLATLVVSVVGGSASLAWAWHLRDSDPIHAYYGTDTRAYQLLAGAALAALFARFGASTSVRARHGGVVAQSLGLVALLLLVTGFVSPDVMTRGVLATVATVVLLAGMELGRVGPAARLLSTTWMARLGRVSYGTYLWHWVVIVVLLQLTSWQPVVIALVTAVVATGFAFVSFSIVEKPIRTSRWLAARPTVTVAAGIGISLVLAFFTPRIAHWATPALQEAAAPITDTTPVGSVSGAAGSAGSSTTTGAPLDWKAAKSDGGVAPSCVGKDVSDCRVVDSGPSAPVVVLAGDSHARSTIRMFEDLAKAHHWTLYATIGSGCPWQWGMLYPRSWGAQTDACVALQDDWFTRVIPSVKPDTVILASYSFDDPSGLEAMRPADPSQEGLSQARLADVSVQRSLEAVAAAGARALIVDPFPISGHGNPLACLSRGKAPATCDFTVDPRPVPATARYLSLASTMPGVFVVNLDTVVCPSLPVCPSVYDGIITHRDHDHVTATFLQHQAPLAYRAMTAAGIVPGVPSPASARG